MENMKEAEQIEEPRGFLYESWANWKGTLTSIKDYWILFGGWRALLGSVYFAASFAAGAVLLWQGKLDPKWWDSAMSMLPNLLGFTVAAYAILIAFGDEEFKKVIIEYPKKRRQSFFLTINGTFCHFIIVQCLTLLYANIFNMAGLKNVILQGLGTVLLIYSLLLAIAVALAVLRIAMVYQDVVAAKARQWRDSNAAFCRDWDGANRVDCRRNDGSETP